jgi:uroporphyrinogen decarboxylase
MTPEVVADQARRLLEALRGWPGHIFNLGHGLPPGATLDNIEALTTTVQQFR